MRVCSQVPFFIPWVGFWNKMLNSDAHVISAGVQFEKQDFGNRVKLDGQWLTLPIRKSKFDIACCDVEVLGTKDIATRIEKTLCVKRYKYHDRIHPILEYLKSTDEKRLSRINIALYELVLDALNLKVTLHLDILPSDPNKSKTLNLFERLERHVSPPFTYMSGPGSITYFNDYEIPTGVGIEIQKVKSFIQDESIVKVLVSEEDPISWIKESAEWSKHDIKRSLCL